MQIDHVHFYVEDASQWRDWFVQVMGMQAIAQGYNDHTHTEVVSSGVRRKNSTFPVTFVLSSPLSEKSPVAEFLSSHPPGVADVAFVVTNLTAMMKNIIAADTKVLSPMQQWKSAQGQLGWSQIISNFGLTHTLIQRTGKTPLLPYDWLLEEEQIGSTQAVHFTHIDHVVLNVAAGELESTVNWYEEILGFHKKQSFTIQTHQSGLYSQVVVHPISGVQLPINEPISPNSQIQEFLDINQGAGIQHIALKSPRITEVIQKLRATGLSFLDVPYSYYEQLEKLFHHLNFSLQEWQEIIRQKILVDQEEKFLLEDLNSSEIQSNPLLLQIFTQPIFTQPTFFFEFIERRYQAKGFGEGNFKALFEAIEREQVKRGSLDKR